jgi:uncharacterized membrane protein
MERERSTGSRRRQTILYRRIISVMNAGFVIAIGLMLAGLLVGIVTGDHVAKETDPLREVLPGVLRLDAQDIVDLGIIVLLATPAAYVVVALATFLRDRDLLFVTICLLLLGILSLSVGLTIR